MTHVLMLEGLDHWVAFVKPDGTNEGIDYLNVTMFCGRKMRFRRYVKRRHEGLPSHEGTPNCFDCVVMQAKYKSAEKVMRDAGGEKSVAWLHQRMGGTPI